MIKSKSEYEDIVVKLLNLIICGHNPVPVDFPECSIKGLSYIDSVNQARALDIAKAAEAKSVSAMIKANKSFIVSVAALVATLIINLDKIVHNVKAILSYLSTL